MNPLIYIPGQKPRITETLEELGLGPMLDPAFNACWSDVFSGTPDGERGLLVRFDCPSRPASSSPTGLRMESQEWREAAKCGDLPPGRFWIGWEKDAPPTPEDLRRSNTIIGEPVLLLDGNLWEIAVSSFIPRRWGINVKTGEEERKPQSEFIPYIERCRGFEALFMESGSDPEEIAGTTMTLPGGFTFATEALGMNYRVTRDLVDGLEWFGDEQICQTVFAATGITTAANIVRQKKTTERQLTPAG